MQYSLLHIADVLQQYANTKTLALWLHMSFAKRGATLTKCRHRRGRQKSESSKQSPKYEQEQQKHAYLLLLQQSRPWLKYLDESFIKIKSLIEK